MDSQQDFHEFVAAHGRGLMRTAYILTGDHHRAEDVLQTVLAKCAVRWSRRERPANPEAYARAALYREMCSWWRVRRNHEIPHDELPDHSGTNFAETSETRMVLAKALLQVSARQRAMLVLRFYEDRSEAETAQLLGCAVGTVKSQTHKALRKLRRIVPDLDIHDPSPETETEPVGALSTDARTEGAVS